MESLSEFSDEEKSNNEWEVEKILKQRTLTEKDEKTEAIKKIRYYLVKWVGYKKPTWEPEENLTNCEELLKDFLLSQIMKKLKQTNDSPRKNKKKKLINNKRKTPDTESNEEEEEKENDSTTVSNSMIMNVNKKKNKKKKKIENNFIKETDVGLDIESEKEIEIEISEEKEIPCENKEDIHNDNDKDNYSILDKDENEDIQGIKVLRINYMKIPKNIDEGITLNINYEKNGKTFNDIFNTKDGEIPKDYLVKYYEMFLCKNFQKGKYSEEMSFE